jgi:hypothetical protein
MPRHFMRLLENVIPKVYCILCLDKINTLYALLGILRNAQAFYETPKSFKEMYNANSLFYTLPRQN